MHKKRIITNFTIVIMSTSRFILMMSYATADKIEENLMEASKIQQGIS